VICKKNTENTSLLFSTVVTWTRQNITLYAHCLSCYDSFVHCVHTNKEGNVRA